jgi:hypothetical protein
MPLWYNKMDSYRWINGSIRQDLEPDERSVWADFLALAGLTREPRRGYIERSEGVPYTKQALITMLNISEELFDRAVKKCVNEGRLQSLEDGTLFLTNWGKYNETKPKQPSSQEALDKITIRNAVKNPALAHKAEAINGNRVVNDSGEILASPESLINEKLPAGIDPVLGEIVTCYSDNIGPVTALVADELKLITDDLKASCNHDAALWFKEATLQACKSNVRKLAYVQAIIDNWKVNGFRSNDAHKKNTPPVVTYSKGPAVFKE